MLLAEDFEEIVLGRCNDRKSLERCTGHSIVPPMLLLADPRQIQADSVPFRDRGSGSCASIASSSRVDTVAVSPIERERDFDPSYSEHSNDHTFAGIEVIPGIGRAKGRVCMTVKVMKYPSLVHRYGRPDPAVVSVLRQDFD